MPGPPPEPERDRLLVEDLPQQPARLVEMEAALDTILSFSKPRVHQCIKLAFGACHTDWARGTIARGRIPEVIEATNHRPGPLAND